LCVPKLDDVWQDHGGTLTVDGRYKKLLYHVISRVVSAPRSGAVLVVDADGKFDVSALSCSKRDLQNVYIVRPPDGRKGVVKALNEATKWLLKGELASIDRELVLKIVSGFKGTQLPAADIVCGWRGWMHVYNGAEEVQRFLEGISVHEAEMEKHQRADATGRAGWVVAWASGEYKFMAKQA
jgi:hypothetical protein